MNLEEFITDTLTQIIKAVQKADEQARADGSSGRVNPPVLSSPANPKPVFQGNVYRTTEIVAFDVALTASNEQTGGGKVGVHIASIGAELTSTNTSVSRVKFSVPILFPQGPK